MVAKTRVNERSYRKRERGRRRELQLHNRHQIPYEDLIGIYVVYDYMWMYV